MFNKKMPTKPPMGVYTQPDDPELRDYIFITDNTDVGGGVSTIYFHVTQVDELIDYLREAKESIISQKP